MRILFLQKAIVLRAQYYWSMTKVACVSLRNTSKRENPYSNGVEESRSRDILAWVAAHLILFTAFSFYAFKKNIGWLFPGGDGAYPIHILFNQRIWSAFSFGQSWNPLQGLGDIDFPLNTWLIPGYAIPAFLMGAENATTPLFLVASHTTFALELFIATLCLSRSVGVPWYASLSAAWAAPLGLLPFFGVPLLYPLLLLAPHISTVIADCTLVLAAFTFLGERNSAHGSTLRRDASLTLVILALLVHMLTMSPTSIILFAPILGFGLLGLIAGSDKKSRVTKLVALAFFVIALFSTGFASFLYGVFDYTVPHLMGNRLELVSTSQDWAAVSNWFYPPAKPARVLLPLAAIGFLFAILFGKRRLRMLSFVTASIMVAIFSLGAIFVNTDGWRLPSLVYYEIIAIPMYVIFASYGIAFALRLAISVPIALLGTGSGGTNDMLFRKMILLSLIVPVVAYFGARPIHNTARPWGPLPPRDTTISSFLRDRIGLTPGEPFRGRVATLLMIDKNGPVRWTDLVTPLVRLIDAKGNDHYWSGLWPKQVPTLIKYSPLISPPFFLTAVHLLALPIDPQMRNVLMLRRPEHRALALLGVRYVVTDTPLPPPFRLELSERIDSDYDIYLYEVPNVNVGTYSPVKVVRAHSYTEALDRLADATFSPGKEVILFEDIPAQFSGALSSASNITLRTVREGLEIEARSDGNSLVLIPFEFSKCLTLKSNVDDAIQPQLLRVNSVLTGVVFHTRLKAKISYFTSPFLGSSCRIQDANEFKLLAH